MTPAETLPRTMQAWRLHAFGQPLRLETVPVPEPTGAQVLLRVLAAGLCHSDLNLIDASEATMRLAGHIPLPFTLGHEVVGTVVATGPDATVALGSEHMVHGIWSCGRCHPCRTGRDNYCLALTGAIGGGIGHDGGLAEFMLVPSARHLVPSRGEAHLQAPLTDAALTAFHCIQQGAERIPGGHVTVLGVGGLGHLAVQIAHTLAPGRLTAVDISAEARNLAMTCGAEHAYPAAELAARAEGATSDLILDFVGSDETVAAYPDLIAPGGLAVLAGSGGGSITVGKGAELPRGWTLTAPFWGTSRDLHAVAELFEAGALHPETQLFTFAEVPRAYAALRNHQVRGRAVVLFEPNVSGVCPEFG